MHSPLFTQYHYYRKLSVIGVIVVSSCQVVQILMVTSGNVNYNHNGDGGGGGDDCEV